MKLNEYQIESRRTAVYLENLGQNLWYPTLKLVGEVGELIEEVIAEDAAAKSDRVSILKEAGDILWYIAAVCSEAQIKFGDVATASQEISISSQSVFTGAHVLVAVARLSEYVGKIYRDYGGDCGPYRDQIACQLSFLFFWLQKIAEEHGSTIEEVADLNLAKLRDRQERGVLGGSGSDR